MIIALIGIPTTIFGFLEKFYGFKQVTTETPTPQKSVDTVNTNQDHLVPAVLLESESPVDSVADSLREKGVR